MNIEIDLKYNYGYQWFVENGIYVKGYLFDQNDNLLEGAGLAAYFCEVVSEWEFRQKLEVANGMFSVIINCEDTVYIGVDRSRTFPLFYTIRNEELWVSDKSDTLGVHGLSEHSVAEFLYTGYVTGRDTLLENVFQMESGSYCIFNKGKLKQSYYFQCERTNVHNAPDNILEQGLVHIMDKIGERLVRKLNGRTAVIPLSGGYDSRMIATLLKKFNYPKVITYTYGTPSSPDVRTSKTVAKHLNFPWHFIEYKQPLINGFVQSASFKEYFPFASNHVSGFFTQDYFAVKFLKDHKIVPDDAVFIPGHKCNDAFDEIFILDLKTKNVVDCIIKNRYILRRWPKDFEKELEKKMLCQSPIDNFVNWTSKEMLSKFLVNSNRIYEYFGWEHLMPLWDKDLALFVLNLNDYFRDDYKLLKQVWFKYYFQPFHVAFAKKEYPFLMQKCVGVFNRSKRFFYTDMNNFKHIAKMFLDDEPLDVRWDSVKVNINEIQSTWYIKQLEKKIT